MSAVANELKPCPFCGGPAERIEIKEDDGFENRGGSVIECQQCHASSHVEFGRKENLVSAWNSRLAPANAFKGTVDGDTELQAATRHAGWALIELVDEIDWLKREQVSDIITRLGNALNEPSEDIGKTHARLELSPAHEQAFVEGDLIDLLERLDHGLVHMGDACNGQIELFDTEAAEDLFADAASAIRILIGAAS